MDIVKVFGANLKRLREERELSQEAFAELCGMHRTYISAIERQRRSISLENVQRIANALEIETYLLFIDNEKCDNSTLLDRRFLRNVPLPPDLTNENIFQAMADAQEFFLTIRRDAGIVLSEIIQSNNFSGIVSNVFTKKLSDVSVYHLYRDQRYPDLTHKSKSIGLEVKASNKAWKGGEAHNGHSGWHIIVCYAILPNGDIEFIQAEIANLVGFEAENSDWKYQCSKLNDNYSQRTETYITTAIGAAKLRDGSVYLNSERVSISTSLYRNRYSLETELPVPDYSPFSLNRE
jgi:transcriptional regulator with XRE-family HTH domain